MNHCIPAFLLMALCLSGCASADPQMEGPLFQASGWIFANRTWLFDGIVVAVTIAVMTGIFTWRLRRQDRHEAAVLREEAAVSDRSKERRANNRRNMLAIILCAHDGQSAPMANRYP